MQRGVVRVPVEDASFQDQRLVTTCSAMVFHCCSRCKAEKSLLDAMVLQPRIENEWNEWNNRYYIITYNFFFFHYSFSILFDCTDNRRENSMNLVVQIHVDKVIL